MREFSNKDEAVRYAKELHGNGERKVAVIENEGRYIVREIRDEKEDIVIGSVIMILEQ